MTEMDLIARCAIEVWAIDRAMRGEEDLQWDDLGWADKRDYRRMAEAVLRTANHSGAVRPLPARGPQYDDADLVPGALAQRFKDERNIARQQLRGAVDLLRNAKLIMSDHGQEDADNCAECREMVALVDAWLTTQRGQ